MIRVRKSDFILRIVNGSFVDLPCPSRISYFWNFGSLLGGFLGFQILTGIFLGLQYRGDIEISFFRVVHIIRDVNFGWLIRVIHANGARVFFMFMYFHIGRGIYYGSFRFNKTWLRGVTILLLSIATAFLGYVLPWGQMSFWAATVITNLLSAVPYFGVILVEWIWGGFAVSNPTLVRFFSFHFVLPFIILGVLILHLVFLHETGSRNVVGVVREHDKVLFHPYYSWKDVYGLSLFLIFYIMFNLEFPFMFIDVENFISSNPLITPIHIQPEWYFLFAYAILRSVSRKIGGVIALVMSIFVLYFLPMIYNFRFRSVGVIILIRVVFWGFVVNWLLLTWIGICEVETPYINIGIFLSFLYFVRFVLLLLIGKILNKVIF